MRRIVHRGEVEGQRQRCRVDGNGVRFDWLTFDEGYGSKTPFLGVLSMMRQKDGAGGRPGLPAGSGNRSSDGVG